MKILNFIVNIILRKRRPSGEDNKSSAVPIAGSVSGLAAISRGRVLVGGELVYADLNSAQNAISAAKALQDYVVQPSREVYSDLSSRVSRSNPRVRVHVHRLAVSNSKLRVGFLVDGYMAWGRKKAKGRVALIGGMELVNGFHIDVLIFENGKLISMSDQTLPQKTSFTFSGHLQTLVANISGTYEGIKFVVAAPLDDFDIPGATHIGTRPYSYIRYTPLRTVDKQRHVFVLPAAICMASLLAYIGVLAFDVARFRAEGIEHDRAAQAPEFAQGGGKVDAGVVGVLNQRRQFMETPREQLGYVRTMARVVRGLAPMKDAVVEELVVPAPAKEGDAGSSERAAVRLTVSLPSVGDSVYDQGVGVVDMLTQSTRMGWRLVPQGAKDDGKKRKFTLEGISHG